MQTVTFRLAAIVLFSLVAPIASTAAANRIVEIRDGYYLPSTLTIQAGDSVRWVSHRFEQEPHNVAADDGSFNSGVPSYIRPVTFTFTQAGVYPYHCSVHAGEGLRGVIIVEGTVATPFDIDPGHSGNWWGGPERSGEGAQIEVADGGGGDLVFVVTFYAYGPAGGQIFLVGVGTPAGDAVDVDVYITDGAVWGDGFDPADVAETQWGTGQFTAQSCDQMHMLLTPNLAYQAEGYTSVEYDLTRLTTPVVACPRGQ